MDWGVFLRRSCCSRVCMYSLRQAYQDKGTCRSSAQQWNSCSSGTSAVSWNKILWLDMRKPILPRIISCMYKLRDGCKSLRCRMGRCILQDNLLPGNQWGLATIWCCSQQQERRFLWIQKYGTVEWKSGWDGSRHSEPPQEELSVQDCCGQHHGTDGGGMDRVGEDGGKGRSGCYRTEFLMSSDASSWNG